MPAQPTKQRTLGQNTARSLTLLYIGQGFNILITVATFVVLTRLLGPSTYGLYVFAFGFSALIGSSGNFGISVFLSKNLAKFAQNKDAKGITRTIASGYAVLLPVAVILTLVGVALSGYAANMLFPNVGITAFSLVLASLTIFFLMVQNTTVGALIGFFRAKEAAITTIVIDLVQLVSIVALLLTGHGLNGAIVGMILGYIVGTALALVFMLRAAMQYKGFHFVRTSWAEFKAAFYYAAPLGANNILNVGVQNFSILLLGLYVSTAALGNYGVALKGISLMAVLYSTMSNVLVPAFSAAGERNPRNVTATYNKIMIYSLILALPTIVYIGVMARPEITLFFSSSYSSAPLYLTLIAFGTAISLIGYFLGSLIAARNLTTKFLLYNLAATIVELVMLIALTPYYQVIGAIVAVFIIGNIATNFFLIRLARDYMKVKLNYRKMVVITAANLLLAIPLYAALFVNGSILQLVVGFIILVLVYPPVLGLLRLVDSADLDRAIAITARMRFVGALTERMCNYARFFLPNRGATHG